MIGQLILIAILTTINAFFAASEMAIVSLNKNRIKVLSEKGNKKAKLLQTLINEPSNFLATIQVGITFAGFFSSAFAATGLSDRFSVYLTDLNVPYSQNIAIIVITIILSYLTLVFGELFPKRVALVNPEMVAMFTVRPVIIVSKVMVPFVKLLSLSTSLLVKVTRLDKRAAKNAVSEDEIKSLVEAGYRQGTLNNTEKQMIYSVFAFDNKKASAVMTPIEDVFMIDVRVPTQEIIDLVLERNFSRIPIYQDHPNQIIGILYLKELLLEARKEGFQQIDLRSILHKPYFEHMDEPIDDLFKQLQFLKTHMAILINEKKEVQGIVTIEDLIEEVMGEIYDEHDDDKLNIIRVDDNSYLISGELSLENFNRYLNIDPFVIFDQSLTIGEVITAYFGATPNEGDSINLENDTVTIQISKVENQLVKEVKVILNE